MARRGGYFTREQLHFIRYVINELECCYEYDDDGFEEMVDSIKETITDKLKLN